jgi:hypothetical protein
MNDHPHIDIDFASTEDWRDEHRRRLAYRGGELGLALHVAAQHGIRLGQAAPKGRSGADPLALTLTAAARRLGIAKEHLRRLIDEQRVRTVRWPGRTAGVVGSAGRIRIPLSEVERIAQEGFAPVPRAKAPQPKPRAPHLRIKDLPY